MEGDVRQAPSHALQEANERRRADYLSGIVLLMFVVILWTASNFLTQSLMIGGYDKPFAMTYANTSSFALYMIPFGCALRRGERRDRGAHLSAPARLTFWERLGFRLPSRSVSTEDIDESIRRRRANCTPVTATELRVNSETTRLHPRPSSIDGRRPRNAVPSETRQLTGTEGAALTSQEAWTSSLPPLSLIDTAVLAAQFTVIWFAANWSLNAGLGLTSVASGTTLSSASGFFTLALGTIFGVEHFTRSKLIAVTMSFIGVIMVTSADTSNVPEIQFSDKPGNAPLGDCLALLSAFFYALYVTLLKVRIGSEDRISMPLFFGFVGLFNITCLWPIGLCLHLTGVEPFAWPTHTSLTGVLINMAITFVSDFAYLLAMLKSSPLVATVGLSLTIPLAVFGDFVRGSRSGGLQADLGSTVVLLSFVAIGLADNAALATTASATDPLASPLLNGTLERAGHGYERSDRSQ